MLRHRCPMHDKNKLAHSAFIQLFAGFQARYAVEGPQPELLLALHRTVANWIRDHILAIDTRLRPCLIPPARPRAEVTPQSWPSCPTPTAVIEPSTSRDPGQAQSAPPQAVAGPSPGIRR